MNTRSFWQHHAPLLAMIFLIALAVRAYRATNEGAINPDIVRFVDQARTLLADPLTAVRQEAYHPLHALLGGLVSRLLPTSWFSHDNFRILAGLRIVGITCGALVAVLIFILARQLGARTWPAAAAALLWVVGRRTSVFGADAMSDMLFLACFTGAAICTINGLRQLTRHRPASIPFALSGLFAALSYLTRPEGLAISLITVAALATLLLHQRVPLWRKFLRRRATPTAPVLRAIATHLLVLALISAPYILTIGGLTQKKNVLPAPILQPASLATIPAIDPYAWAKIGKEIFETFGFAPCIVLGLAMLLKPRLWGRPRLRPISSIWFTLWLAVMLWLLASAGYLDGRHTLPLIILLHALFALSFIPIRRLRAAAKPLAFAAFLFAIAPGLAQITDPHRADKYYLQQAAHWVDTNAGSNAILYEHHKVVAFYAQRPATRIHTLDFPGTQRELAPLLAQTPAQPTYILCHVADVRIAPPTLGAFRLATTFKSPLPANHDGLLIYTSP